MKARREQINVPAIQTYLRNAKDAELGIKRQFSASHLCPSLTWMCPACEHVHKDTKRIPIGSEDWPDDTQFECINCIWTGNHQQLLTEPAHANRAVHKRINKVIDALSLSFKES